MKRGFCIAMAGLLACTWAAVAEEYKGVKIKKTTGTSVVLVVDEKEKKTVEVHLTKDTRYFDKEDNELKDAKGAKLVKVGKVVDVTTELVKPATIFGKNTKVKDDVEVISNIKFV